MLDVDGGSFNSKAGQKIHQLKLLQDFHVEELVHESEKIAGNAFISLPNLVIKVLEWK